MGASGVLQAQFWSGSAGREKMSGATHDWDAFLRRLQWPYAQGRRGLGGRAWDGWRAVQTAAGLLGSSTGRGRRGAPRSVSETLSQMQLVFKRVARAAPSFNPIQFVRYGNWLRPVNSIMLQDTASRARPIREVSMRKFGSSTRADSYFLRAEFPRTKGNPRTS